MSIIDRYRAFKYKYGPKYRRSYSQQGEDMVISKLLKTIGVKKPFYIDIGAHHPTDISNTYTFYRGGGSGILIEPDRDLCKKLRSKRPRDIVVEAGVGPTRGTLKFYEFEEAALNTFSEADMLECQRRGCKVKAVRDVEVVTFADIIERYNVKKIDLLSIDVEGWDLEIIKSIDFSKIRPAVICTETKKHDEPIPENTPVADILRGHGYQLIYSLVNSVFVDPTYWKKN